MNPDHLPGSSASSINVIAPAEAVIEGRAHPSVNWSGAISRKGRDERAGVVPFPITEGT